MKELQKKLNEKEKVKMNQNMIINVEEIKIVYREYCKQTNLKFSKNDFARFLKFLQIDFYDWVKGNLRYFNKENEIKQQSKSVLGLN